MTDLLIIAISHNVTFIGKAWWVLMLALRSLLLLLAGFTLFSDEQQRFVCNTIQPGCSNVCFDVFAPVSVLRLWFFQLVFLSLPHFVFATYVVHKVLSHPCFEGICGRGGLPFTLENCSSSREVSLPRDWGLPRFYCAYFLVVILRILLEAIFTAGQFFLIGSSVPKSFFCYEAPCTSGVECYVSRPTEKTFMINFMLGVACLSILLSLVDLVGCLKAIARCRRKKELLMEEMSKGEQSSVFTAATDDTDVQLTKRMSPTGSSKMNGLRDEKPNGEKTNGGATLGERNPESNDGKADTFRSPAAASAPAPAHFVPHSHSRAPLSWRYDGGTSPNPKATTLLGVTKPDQDAPAGTNGGQTDSSECQDKRAWV
ncbi:gap junction delta-4 protein-like [Salarias fasciatus]|uniref:gap junction delta-4 protein-like n=1 Tax=Salarias fasciatus TaxID=181472 RepID=UPI001176C082|nr:gap junction delta-4 protein-like [Salarias fasciatus]